MKKDSRVKKPVLIVDTKQIGIGVSGSGKSTLLSSSLTNMLSKDGNNLKIIYEDPIEFFYDDVGKAFENQLSS